MIIGPNKICHEYNDLIRAESFWGLETPELQFIHPKGKYAIVERLPYPIDSLDWKSDPLGDLDPEDMNYLNPLRILIQFFIDEKNSPKDLKVEHLRFDAIGRLKSIKNCIPGGKMDYIALEEMAYQLAQTNNLPVYQYLIEPLCEDKYSKKKLIPFFRDVLMSVFEKHPVSIERLAKKREIEDQRIIQRGSNLQYLAQQLKDESYEILSQRYPLINKEKLRAQLYEVLQSLYDKNKTFGRFWNHVRAEDLIEEIEKTPEHLH
jgi:hypothetical protein